MASTADVKKEHTKVCSFYFELSKQINLGNLAQRERFWLQQEGEDPNRFAHGQIIGILQLSSPVCGELQASQFQSTVMIGV